MQIFCPSADPAISAQVLDDARIIKMATETAQLLSAAVRIRRLVEVIGPTVSWQTKPFRLLDVEIYKAPTSGPELYMWAAKTDGNWDWLACHGKAIVEELDHRGLCVGKLIRPRELLELFYQPVAKQAVFAGAPTWSRHKPAADFINRTVNQSHGLDFRHVADVHDAYGQYLAARWVNEPNAKWTNRQKPAF